MRDIDYYMSLIPSWNSSQPKFEQMIDNLIRPLINAQAAHYAVRDSFDLDTAVGVQLDQIGLWIGRSRNILIPITNVYFTWGTASLGWGFGVWKGPYDPGTGVVTLDDGTYRALLKAQALANGWDGTLVALNAIYEALLGYYVQVQDNQNMTITVTIGGAFVSPILLKLLTQGYLNVKPAGVSISYTII